MVAKRSFQKQPTSAEARMAKTQERHNDVMAYQRKQQEEATAKLQRLRVLRLAKEVSDKEAAVLAKEAELPRTRKRAKAPA